MFVKYNCFFLIGFCSLVTSETLAPEGVFSGSLDPTKGARFWDGADFLAKGVKQNKFKEYSEITISSTLYDKYSAQTLKNYPKAKYLGFSIPATVFKDLENWDKNCTFNFKTEAKSWEPKLEATAVGGGTIFWKTIK